MWVIGIMPVHGHRHMKAGSWLVLFASLNFYICQDLLYKLAPASQMEGAPVRRSGVYTLVHDASSTGATDQVAAGVEFKRRANESARIS